MFSQMLVFIAHRIIHMQKISKQIPYWSTIIGIAIDVRFGTNQENNDELIRRLSSAIVAQRELQYIEMLRLHVYPFDCPFQRKIVREQ